MLTLREAALLISVSDSYHISHQLDSSKRSMSEPMDLPLAQRMLFVALGSDIRAVPLWYEEEMGEVACDLGGGQVKKRKRVNMVVSRLAREKWRDMVLIQVSDASRGVGVNLFYSGQPLLL